MTYIDYLNRFNQWTESNDLPLYAVVLYYRLLDRFNRAGWPRNLRVDTLRLMLMAGCQKDAAYRARDKLAQAGFIRYEKGTKGKPTTYFLSDILSFKTTETPTVSATETATETATGLPTQRERLKTKTKTKNSPPSSSREGEGQAAPKFPPEDRAYQAAVYLDKQIQARLGEQPVGEKRLQAWADAFDKCHRIDGHSWEDIGGVLRFSQKDPFWSSVILSGRKFREKYVQLLAKMRQDEGARQKQGRGDFPDYGNREDYV